MDLECGFEIDGGTLQPSSAVWKRRACLACTRSKRRCNKAAPGCRRCRDRGMECVYPRPEHFVRSLGFDSSLGSGTGFLGARDEVPMTLSLPPPLSLESMLLDGIPAGVMDVPLLGSPCLVPAGQGQANTSLCGQIPSFQPLIPQQQLQQQHQHSSYPHTDENWFLQQESWPLQHRPPAELPSEFDDSALLHIARVQSFQWLEQWLAEGHNPFLHGQLYRRRMPLCIQDAFTTLSAYVHRQPATQDVTFRIIRDRVLQLVGGEQVTRGQHRQQLDALSHLARVQALLMYQMVRLFDGDVGMRSQAEKLIPTLEDWASQMYEATAEELRRVDDDDIADDGDIRNRSKCTNRYGLTAARLGSLDADALSFTWRLWIVAESVRRTYLTSRVLQSIYLLLRDGESACPGGVFFSARRGVWDAPSAHAWAGACRGGGGGPLFVQSIYSERLFSLAAPAEVDEFTRLMLEVTFGREVVDRWADQSLEG